MTITNFDEYKKISKKILSLLIDENHSSLADIKILYNITMGFPYCLDREGHCAYHGEFYNTMDDLPLEAKQHILNDLNHYIPCLSDTHISEQ